jgi:hypothetical protein
MAALPFLNRVKGNSKRFLFLEKTRGGQGK